MNVHITREQCERGVGVPEAVERSAPTIVVSPVSGPGHLCRGGRYADVGHHAGQEAVPTARVRLLRPDQAQNKQ